MVPIDACSRQIVVTDKDCGDNRLYVTARARITLDGWRATLAGLRAGDRVVVTFHEDARGRVTATGFAAVCRLERRP